MVMPVTNFERLVCLRCGHESDSRFRFCGMCGSKLPDPLPNPEAKSSEVAGDRSDLANRVSGPSFLGLTDEPADSTAYLLDDDQTHSHRGRVLLVLLLLIASAAAIWHWRHDLRAWAERKLQQPAVTQAGQTTYTAAPISTAGSEVAGSMPTAQTMTQSTESESPQAALGAPNTNPTTPQQASQNNQPPAPAQSAAAPPEKNDVSSTAAVSKSPAGTKTPNPRSQIQSPSSAQAQEDHAGADNEGAAAELEGEKFLYATGTPGNCARAQKSLMAAAEQANSRAESVLGTMYATGHCATRDLPLAYFWFARAMQQEPNNARVEHDLTAIWNQMGPDERQLATHLSGH